MFTLFLSLYSTISSVSLEVKTNGQKRSIFHLIAHKVLDSQWKKRYFWVVPEPLVQQLKKKTLGLWGREWNKVRVCDGSKLQTPCLQSLDRNKPIRKYLPLLTVSYEICIFKWTNQERSGKASWNKFGSLLCWNFRFLPRQFIKQVSIFFKHGFTELSELDPSLVRVEYFWGNCFHCRIIWVFKGMHWASNFLYTTGCCNGIFCETHIDC